MSQLFVGEGGGNGHKLQPYFIIQTGGNTNIMFLIKSADVGAFLC